MWSIDLAQAAARRWRIFRPESPERAAAAPASFTVEPGRDPRRLARLNRTAAAEKARALVFEAAASPRGRRSQHEVIESIGQERVIGSSDLADINFLELAIAMSRAVGRIRAGNAFGTGFLVGPGLVMTNHHVIGSPGEASQSFLELDYQDNASGQLLPIQAYPLDPGTFFLSDQALDFTIAGLQPVSRHGRPLDTYPWVKLIGDIGKANPGDSVNIIQHPRGGLKQIAFRRNEVIALPQAVAGFLYYTTDTEPGSSGSPCFNDQWELVALHHSGVPATDAQGRLLKKDKTPWREGEDPELLDWIANEGVRVSAIVAFLNAAAPRRSEWRDSIAQMLSLRPPNPIELARAGDAGQAPPASVSPGHTWTIPLQITVCVGGISGGGAPPTPPPAEPPAVVEEKVVIDPDYASRPGYDAGFLETFPVPLPALAPALLEQTAELLPDFQQGGNRYELKYYHYSVVMNRQRRTAWFSAANIDGDHRFSLGPRADSWSPDPRVAPDAQLTQKAFESGIDRGHITRRDDVAWGATIDDARNANNDTFHFTNCSLQASAFNRGRDRWQGLEQFLLEQHAKKDKRRMVVITGPVFAPNDPPYRNANMDYTVRCPLNFWKVCVLIRDSDQQPSATAFVLNQDDIGSLPGFEEAALFDVKLAQITLADLEARTGLDFGALKDHDHFAQGGPPGTLEVAAPGGRRVRLVRAFEDILV
ncbi:MAG TPA: DNA/RNA non-specific endonuclease [Bryobacteraceae bacterium]|nr:DNA/RNA non-specific endonuclease [Bryobacteraceae bacterium]